MKHAVLTGFFKKGEILTVVVPKIRAKHHDPYPNRDGDETNDDQIHVAASTPWSALRRTRSDRYVPPAGAVWSARPIFAFSAASDAEVLGLEPLDRAELISSSMDRSTWAISP